MSKTICAVCNEKKECPLRRDEMGGHVCLTCINKKLDDIIRMDRIREYTHKKPKETKMAEIYQLLEPGHEVRPGDEYYHAGRWDLLYPEGKIPQGIPMVPVRRKISIEIKKPSLPWTVGHLVNQLSYSFEKKEVVCGPHGADHYPVVDVLEIEEGRTVKIVYAGPEKVTHPGCRMCNEKFVGYPYCPHCGRKL